MDARIADQPAAVQLGFPSFLSSTAELVSGRELASGLRGKTKAGRAVVAALLVERKLVLEQPTRRQIAALCAVNQSYLSRVLALSPQERFDVFESGVLPPARADVARVIAAVRR